MQDIHAELIRESIRLAEAAAAHGNEPFGALLVKDGMVLLRAENTIHTGHDMTNHAEMNLVRIAQAQYNGDFLESCVLYTSTEPCAMCAGAIFWSGIAQVVFGCSEKRLGEIAGAGLDVPCRDIFASGFRRVEVTGPIIEEEAAQPHLRYWKQDTRKKTMVDQTAVSTIKARVAAQREDIIQFLKDLCAIPSYDSKIRVVGERAEAEMKKLGFNEVWFDKMGNVVGRIGDGPKKLLYDSHLDTVGIGDPAAWGWDPFKGKVENGVFFARGACDEKGSTPGMIYGLALAHELGLLDGWTGYYFGNMEEWCDGIAPNSLVETEKLRPDFVVIGEPTRMQVYRGHKGRVEMEVIAKGKSAHAASNFLGDNAIYKLLPIIDAISKLEPELGDDPFLGHGRITVTDMHVKTPSINAVPDEALIYIDRRVTFGETPDNELARIKRLIGNRKDIEASILFYDDASYTGFVFPVDKIYPAWALPADNPFVQAGVKAGELLWGGTMPTGKWDFSTNGTYWMGKAQIPSIGFGPGDEIHAHTVIDQVPLDDVVRATEWYALLPGLMKG